MVAHDARDDEAQASARRAAVQADARSATAHGSAVLLEHVSFRYVDASERATGDRRAATCGGGAAEAAGGGGAAAGGRVDDLSFSVAPGTCTVLCGRSGDGKSTALRLIDGLAGTFFPGELTGAVYVCGIEVRALAPRARTEALGVVMQDPRSQFFMDTVGDEIAFSAENLGVLPAETARRVHEGARVCGVAHLLGERLSELSSGQKQRVALAAAISCNPRVLVLDEPTSNLDAEGLRALTGILAELKRRGTAVVVSEHRLHGLLPVADEYLCLCNGRIAARWSACELAALTLRDAEAFGLRHPGMGKGAAIPDDAFPFASADASALVGNAASAVKPERGWCVEALTYVYRAGGRGVRNVSASFPDGAVTVISGANGAGKTTLAKVLCGVVREQTGHVFLDGVPASRRTRRRASYFVMQDADYQLYAGSVADEVVLGRRVDDRLRARAWEALAAFDLTELAERHPASLSGGQKQRVTLAAAYCSDARLVVLDEPTSGLDGRGVREVAAWCRTLARAGKAVVVITHDELLARLAADAVFQLKGEEVHA